MDPLGEHGFRKPDPELTLDDRGGRTHWTEHKPGSGNVCGTRGISLSKMRHHYSKHGVRRVPTNDETMQALKIP